MMVQSGHHVKFRRLPLENMSRIYLQQLDTRAGGNRFRDPQIFPFLDCVEEICRMHCNIVAREIDCILIVR